MGDNQFILDNLKEGQACREMVMNDNVLFTQDHYDTIKKIIEEEEIITHIATRVYFKQSSIKKNPLLNPNNDPDANKLSLSVFYDSTVMTPITRGISSHLAACDVIEKTFNFFKPNINFH
jgi:hypothetical protein